MKYQYAKVTFQEIPDQLHNPFSTILLYSLLDYIFSSFLKEYMIVIIAR